MSLEARQQLVDSTYTVFRSQSQRDDLLDPSRTNTDLIALLLDVIVARKQPFVFTAIRADHSDDSELGAHSHADGDAVDGWPLASPRDGDYLDAGSPRFLQFLHSIDQDKYSFSIGLGGEAYTSADVAAIPDKEFEDNGSDHVHLAGVLA